MIPNGTLSTTYGFMWGLGGFFMMEFATKIMYQFLINALANCFVFEYLQVVNHGVPDALMDAAMDMAKRFFALPSTEKEEFKIRKVGGLGYGRYFEKPGATKDWVDRAITCTYNIDMGEPYDLKYTNPPGFQ